MTLDPDLPPGYSPDNGWFGAHGSALDLCYRALMIKRLADDNINFDDPSPKQSSSKKVLKNKSTKQLINFEMNDANLAPSDKGNGESSAQKNLSPFRASSSMIDRNSQEKSFDQSSPLGNKSMSKESGAWQRDRSVENLP